MMLTRPRTLEDALAVLAAGPAKPLAGGTDLMVEWSHRAAPPAHVVDLWQVTELRGVRRDGQGARLGALTTCSELLRLPDDAVPGADLWRAAACEFAAEQIRNRATLGGNLATASPASDLAPVLLALGASVRLRGRDQVRDVPAAAFFTGYRQTACAPGELIESVWVPDRRPFEQRALRKVGTRAAQAIAKVSVAVCLCIEDGVVVEVRAAAGSVAERPVLLPSVGALAGRAADIATVERAARAAATDDCDPIDDVRSTAAYRRHALARVLRTLLGRAAAGAG